MSGLARFGVSLEERLLESFDQAIAKKGYIKRSEAIRDLIRAFLVEQEWEEGEETVGTVTIVYDHSLRELPDALIEFQHSHFTSIISTLHVHLDQHNCLEVAVIKGKSSEIREIADRLIGMKGVKHGKLCMATTGRAIS